MRRLPILRLPAMAIALGALCGASLAKPASAEPRLYTGTLDLQLSIWDGCTVGASCYNDLGAGYGIPFGTNISYPIANNLPSGDLANVSGSGPAAFSIDSNQITLETSLFETSPPWITVTFAATDFAGGHAAGRLSANGAPGYTGWTSLPSLPYGRLQVGYWGTPSRFGGTLNLLGSWRARWQAPASGYSFYYTYKLPLSPIGGPMGGTAMTQYSDMSHTIWGFPWTAGSAWAMAPEPSGFGDYSFPYTVQGAAGTDQRTPLGGGQLQLVSPFVVRHQQVADPSNAWYQAGVARLTLQFAPEPARGALFAAGLLALGALYRLRRPARRRAR